MRLAEVAKVRYQHHENVFVPRVNRRHKLNLTVDQLPPLPFFAGGDELELDYLEVEEESTNDASFLTEQSP